MLLFAQDDMKTYLLSLSSEWLEPLGSWFVMHAVKPCHMFEVTEMTQLCQ